MEELFSSGSIPVVQSIPKGLFSIQSADPWQFEVQSNLNTSLCHPISALHDNGLFIC